MIDNARLDLLFAEYGRAIAIALVVIGTLALVASGWAVGNPSTTTEAQYADEHVSTELHTGAEVVQDGTLWNEGEYLENNDVYMLNDSPELTLEPETTVQSEREDVSVDDTEVTHELEARYEATRDGDVFWNESHTVLEESPTVEDGVATSSETIDVESYRDRQYELEQELGGVGDVDLEFVLSVAYDTGGAEGTDEATTPFEVTSTAYWLGDSASVSETATQQTGTEETTESRSLALIAGLSLLGTISLAGAVGIVRRTPVDETVARRKIHERRYAEWISKGSIPMWIGNYHVSLDTLEDVVDVAIDTNERVVHDTQRGLFAVVNDGVVYYYSERGQWEETAWPEMNLSEHGDSSGDGDEPAITPEEMDLEGIDEFSDLDEEGFEDDEDVWKQL
ncbi:DUF5305 domain-containing protein [Natronorubrum daqingense]|uniref:DUF5305 domain-containing protein n=1 Tax=Natronorubrum daqingense TaxID=588898 RepID=A0A1N7AMZ0_9EURY|nr:DUF5305 domain-containing protein [Natronorubrum daqingense]APX97930.1 hypothetical protein BB347_15655 [Natronorubrum daqingense]SIR40442.1 hypothetical protein SAMN05421809_1230 [Natronorubrum daqingense]